MTMGSADQNFETSIEKILQQMWDFYPNMASGMGLHEYDGKLPDISQEAMAKRMEVVNANIESLEAIDTRSLSRQYDFDRRMLVSVLRKELFEHTELRSHQTNPMEMMWHIELSNYLKRDYAPLDQRVTAMTEALGQVPGLIDQLREGLDSSLSKPIIESCIEAYAGLVTFYETDVPKAVEGLNDQQIRERLDGASATAIAAINGFVDHLKGMEERARDDFGIGSVNFSKALRLGEFVDIPLERVLEVGLRDLEQNKARFEETAAQIDAGRSPSEVMAEIAANHPEADKLIPETTDMLEEIRTYLIENEIVSVPSEVRCQITETPSYMRWAFAALDMPGPFETKATETYYYVTPVEEHWNDEQKEEWLTSFNYPSLRNISVHEAYPGHYVHYLHTKSAPSKISHAFGAYSFWEGWGHYTEQMMVEQGFTGDDPKLVMGQLADALLRNSRYVCAIRMHTQGMSVDEATRFFMDNAYMEELPARREAMRGTFDPMYLNYTLGKLMILKLREDYQREQGDAYSTQKFHDTFLSFGAPPIPLVREMMLQNPGNDIL